MADQLHQGGIFVAVGVEVTTLQINVIGRTKPLHHGGLL
jgi:hypothetical protein